MPDLPSSTDRRRRRERWADLRAAGLGVVLVATSVGVWWTAWVLVRFVASNL